jgi:hypothetical protein
VVYGALVPEVYASTREFLMASLIIFSSSADIPGPFKYALYVLVFILGLKMYGLVPLNLVARLYLLFEGDSLPIVIWLLPIMLGSSAVYSICRH